MARAFDHVDLHVVAVTLIGVPIAIAAPGGALAGFLLLGCALVPQPMLWTRAYDLRRSGQAIRHYVLANEIAVVAIVSVVAYLKLHG